MGYYDNLPSFKPMTDPRAFSRGSMNPDDRATMNMRMDNAIPDAPSPQPKMPMQPMYIGTGVGSADPMKTRAITSSFPVLNSRDTPPALPAAQPTNYYGQPPAVMDRQSTAPTAGQQAVGSIAGKTFAPYMADALNNIGSGNYARAAGAALGAAKQAVVNVPYEAASAVGNAAYGGIRSGLNEFIAGARGVPSEILPKITVDKAGNFSRAPTNAAEYKQAMDAKYGTNGNASFNNVSSMGPANAEQIRGAYDRLNARSGGASGTAGVTAKPPISYDDWVMKQPASKLDAEGYARRSQLEMQARAPATLQENIMKSAAYDLAHPDMVTAEHHNRDGSWSKSYGDRGATAMSGYSTFKNALASEAYHNSLAQSARTKADNSEKFTPADKVGMVGQVQQKLMQALLGNGDDSIPAATRIRNARAYWPSFTAALKQNGLEPPEFDQFIQEQTGAVADPAYPGTYKVLK